MKTIFIGLFSIILAVSFPFLALAEWVDADRSGQEGIEVSATGSNVSLALDSQRRPHIAWIDESEGIKYLFWNGSAWVDADGTGQESIVVFPIVGMVSLNYLTLQLKTNNMPAITFHHYEIFVSEDMYYLQWNGSAWVDADGTGQESISFFALLGGNYAGSNSFKFDTLNRPGVVFADVNEINYLYYNGSAWVDADGTGQESVTLFSGSLTGYPSFKYNSSDNPCVAFYNYNGFNSYIYYLYWDGSAWVDADGTGQDEIIIYLVTGNTYPTMTLNNSNQPCIAWVHSSDIYYLYWDGSAWVDADGSGQGEINIFPTAGNSSNPMLAKTSAGYPAVAWNDNTSGSYEIYYLYWDGSTWVDVDGSGQEGVAVYPGIEASIDIDSVNNYPHIAFIGYSVDYLEWWVESPSPSPIPILPESGRNLIGFVNRALGL